MNVFLDKYKTEWEVIPFDEIRFEDYEEAMKIGMEREWADLEQMLSEEGEPTFENIIDRDEDKTLERVTTTFFNLLSADTSDEMDALAEKMQPLLTEHSNRIMMDERFFGKVKRLKERCENGEHRALTPEEQMVLDNLYESFERNGATLPEEKKAVFAAKKQKLAMLTLQFQQNELKDTNAFRINVTDRNELKGMPETALEAASEEAKQHGEEGWTFTLHAPSMLPVMTYCENRELRRELYMAKNTLCTKGEYDNREIVKGIVNLRREIAQMLGYRNWAEYVLRRRMAEKVENVERLLNQLVEAYMPTARKEVTEIEAMAKRMEGDDFILMPWDFGFYSHKLKMERYNIDSEMLRPYFPLEKVKEGVFGLATRLYGITFHKREDIPVYNPDVEAWEVKDEDGSHLAVMYTDFHPRASKQSGAWMTSYKEQFEIENGKLKIENSSTSELQSADGQEMENEANLQSSIFNFQFTDSRPIVSVTMNFTKPTETKPALLTLDEVETFLHEFGHALHGMMSKVRFESLSGTNVYWDFVELPSQFMENYAVEPEFLNTFARHYETGEPLPEELIKRIRESRNFNVAYGCIRQVNFGLLDMAYYTMEDAFDEDIEAFEKRIWAETQLLPTVDGAMMSTQFGHIMCGGYSAGYYSYKWAEVLDADAFAVFQKEGIFNRDTAARFRREVLSRGGTEHPMTLYKRFKGGEPSIEALLRRTLKIED